MSDRRADGGWLLRALLALVLALAGFGIGRATGNRPVEDTEPIWSDPWEYDISFSMKLPSPDGGPDVFSTGWWSARGVIELTFVPEKRAHVPADLESLAEAMNFPARSGRIVLDEPKESSGRWLSDGDGWIEYRREVLMDDVDGPAIWMASWIKRRKSIESSLTPSSPGR